MSIILSAGTASWRRVINSFIQYYEPGFVLDTSNITVNTVYMTFDPINLIPTSSRCFSLSVPYFSYLKIRMKVMVMIIIVRAILISYSF